MALIEAAKQNELSPNCMYELFGALAQQCLSIIASNKGFTTAKSLADVFRKIPHVDRSVVDRILLTLAEDGYLIRHEVKNQYGPSDRLHKLVRARQIYGNFPVDMQMVEVRYEREVTGEIPQFNIDKFEVGDFVTFLANKWLIKEVTPDVINLEPAAEPDIEAASFEYGGRGIGFETFLTEKMWELIHSENFPEEVLVGATKKNLLLAREAARKLSKANNIPFYAAGGGIRYYTFAGASVNEAIALISDKTDFRADDLALTVKTEIDWKSLPTKPQDYNPVFERMFKQTMEQTIFQRMLPWEFQVKEYVQEWLKDESIPNVLSRIKKSKPVRVPDDEWPFE